MKYLVVLFFLCCSPLLRAQQTQSVDFKTLNATVFFYPDSGTVRGQVSVKFHINQSLDSVYLDAKNMTIQPDKTADFQPDFHLTNQKLWFIHTFKAGHNYTVTFHYQAHPQKALYFVGWHNSGSNQIWSQGQGKKTSHWLPSIDDNTDKLIFDLHYVAPKGYTVIGNGDLIDHQESALQVIWHYRMQHPMSSYLVAVAVGKYDHQKLVSASGVPLKLYYEPAYAKNAPWTYRYAKRIFDFLETEIGVPYPWTNYKLIPVRNFLYAGMENTTATIFAESFMTDSIGFIDRNFVNVNAHELAHQWFGNYVTETSSASHWLQEGFASYYALLAEREIFGDDYFYYKLFESAQRLKARSDKGKGESLTDPKANSLTFYKKGAWALFILHHQLGDAAFKKGIQTYLKQYAYQSVSTEDFIQVMEQVSGQDLKAFVNDWLKQSAFQAVQAINALKESSFIQDYLSLVALRQIPLLDKYLALNEALALPVNTYTGQEAVHQIVNADASPQRLELLKKAFATNNTMTRQAIAVALRDIPSSLQTAYESLLDDPSYYTQEKALFNLWKNYPDNRTKYLNTLKNQQGFYTKNIRMLWLTLSLVTPTYKPDKKSVFYQELSHYTSSAYSYTIRQQAFTYLYQINSFTTENYIDLLQACSSPIWRFRQFAHQILTQLLNEKTHQEHLKHLLPALPKQAQQILQNALKTHD